MATDDQQILVAGTASAPAGFTISGTGQIRPKAIFASYNGTGAASSFLPAIKVISDGGKVVGIYPTPTAVAAGASADVSWFPHVGGTGSGNINPVISNQLDYVQITATVDCSAGTSVAPVTIIQGNNVPYDGSTRVRVEAFSGHYDMSQVGGGNFITNLFLDSTNLGRLATFNSDVTNSNLGIPYYGVRYTTPSAGNHAFSIRGWTSTGATIKFECGPGGGAAFDLPGYLRVSS